MTKTAQAQQSKKRESGAQKTEVMSKGCVEPSKKVLNFSPKMVSWARLFSF
jgi:hypothetical protein